MFTLGIQGADALTGAQVQISIDHEPDRCPMCHHGVSPIRRVGPYAVLEKSLGYRAQIIFQCPLRQCAELFIATYRPTGVGFIPAGQLHNVVFCLAELSPNTVDPEKFPEEMAKVSPGFVDIYNQAKVAEANGLSDVAGPGYGKALEFLIKDYLILQAPVEAAAIKSEFLGNVIEKRVTDSKVKATAKRAAWLRNDESHYERRWEGKDLNDLKTLIRVTINWIDSSLVTERYEKEMGG